MSGIDKEILDMLRNPISCSIVKFLAENRLHQALEKIHGAVISPQPEEKQTSIASTRKHLIKLVKQGTLHKSYARKYSLRDGRIKKIFEIMGNEGVKGKDVVRLARALASRKGLREGVLRILAEDSQRPRDLRAHFEGTKYRLKGDDCSVILACFEDLGMVSKIGEAGEGKKNYYKCKEWTKELLEVASQQKKIKPAKIRAKKECTDAEIFDAARHYIRCQIIWQLKDRQQHGFGEISDAVALKIGKGRAKSAHEKNALVSHHLKYLMRKNIVYRHYSPACLKNTYYEIGWPRVNEIMGMMGLMPQEGREGACMALSYEHSFGIINALKEEPMRLIQITGKFGSIGSVIIKRMEKAGIVKKGKGEITTHGYKKRYEKTYRIAPGEEEWRQKVLEAAGDIKRHGAARQAQSKALQVALGKMTALAR